MQGTKARMKEKSFPGQLALRDCVKKATFICGYHRLHAAWSFSFGLSGAQKTVELIATKRLKLKHHAA
jgi:hypothetical protein